MGRKPAFIRPAVIVSTDVINRGELLVVVPVTTRGYALRSHVELEPGENGLTHTSYARCDQVRTISVERMTRQRGYVAPEEMLAIDRALRFVLDL